MNAKVERSTFGSRLLKVLQSDRLVTALLAVVLAVTSMGILIVPHSQAATPQPTGTYTDWHWPSQNYNYYAWTVTPEVDQSGPDAYFYSHQFSFVGGIGGYAGLQGDQEGKRAIFSIWNALAAQSSGIAQPFSGEGTGYQTVIPFNWVAGHNYNFRLSKGQKDNNGTWWQTTVTDQTTNLTNTIGQIKVPASWKGLGNTSIVWTERYGGQMATCSDIHYSSATFTNFSANGLFLPVTPTSHLNHLANPPSCPGSAITDINGGVRQEMGIGNPLPPIINGGSGVSLTSLSWTSAMNGYGPVDINASNGNHIITLNGQRYAQGLGTNAASDIRYNLGGNYQTFSTDVGIDDDVGNLGSVSFQVWADGVELYDSGIMTGPSPTQSISLDVTGRQQLELVVTDGGDGINFDHGDWANPRLVLAPDKTPPSTPATVSAVALSSSQIQLTWAPSTDNVGVTGYRIYRSDKGLATLATVSGTSYTDSGLTTKTAYTYYVMAFDAAGNSSSFSAPATATTQ